MQPTAVANAHSRSIPWQIQQKQYGLSALDLPKASGEKPGNKCLVALLFMMLVNLTNCV